MQVNPGQPFGIRELNGTPFPDKQIPTSGSNFQCQIDANGNTLHFPGNNTGDNYSDVTQGVFYFKWQIRGTADASGLALTMPVISVGSNMVFVSAFETSNSALTFTTVPQDTYTVATQPTRICVECMVQVKNASAQGQTFIKLGTAGAHWPTAITAGDVWVVQMPDTMAPSGLLAEQKLVISAEEKAIQKEKLKERVMFQLLAKAAGVKIPKALLDSDSDDDMEPEDQKKQEEEDDFTLLSPSARPVRSGAVSAATPSELYAKRKSLAAKLSLETR